MRKLLSNALGFHVSFSSTFCRLGVPESSKGVIC